MERLGCSPNSASSESPLPSILDEDERNNNARTKDYTNVLGAARSNSPTIFPDSSNTIQNSTEELDNYQDEQSQFVETTVTEIDAFSEFYQNDIKMIDSCLPIKL